jgi:hypothetical protein
MRVEAALFLAFVTAASGQTRVHRSSTSMINESIDGVVAQLVDGGAWLTIITIADLDTTTTSYTVSFFAENGTPLSIPTTDGPGVSLSGVIPVGGTHTISTLGTALGTSVGWARVTTSNVTGGSAIFRQRVAGRPDFEASMPIMSYVDSNDFVIPFNGIDSSTGIALVNPLSFETITIFLTFRDEQGNRFFLDSITLGSLQHMSFDLVTRYPSAAGMKGSVEIATTAVSMNVLALRFFGAAFTSVLPLEKTAF